MHRRQTPSGQGFSLIELLVVVAIIAVLAALLLPAFSSGKLKAQTVICLDRMRQISLAHVDYARDHSGAICRGADYLPRQIEQSVMLDAYLGGEKAVYRCPADDGTRRTSNFPWGGDLSIKPAYFSYTRNGYIHGIGGGRPLVLSKVALPARTNLLFEEWEMAPMNDSYVVPNAWDLLTQRHNGRAGMSFFDGHTRMVDGEEFNLQSAAWKVATYLEPK